MPTGLRSALQGIIDYAGLFPPAKLPMDAAVASYQRHKSGPEAWIVSRFVCPVHRLAELGNALKGSAAAPVPLTVVGSAGGSGTVRALMAADAKAMMAFDESFGDWGEIESYELKLSSAEIQAGALSDLQAFEAIEVYVELGWTDDFPESLARLAGEDWLRAKARTGGTDSSAFPSSKVLSEFLKHCVDLDLEFKLTAGLHHAFRHWDEALSISHHGFLNVLAACALHEANDLSHGEIAVVLDEGTFGALKCGPEGFAFEDLRASWDDVRRARELFTSFGSCSVEEPLESLKQLEAGEGTPA
ncbi:MAG: hypothetical protein HZC36_03605 [Armatimonadetes bacterium]|nr:hypothetical protein [Armatimonadota bacterium]